MFSQVQPQKGKTNSLLLVFKGAGLRDYDLTFENADEMKAFEEATKVLIAEAVPRFVLSVRCLTAV